MTASLLPQMIQPESTVLTENNTFDVYALSLYSGQISALWIVCFGNYKRSENGLSQRGYLATQ